MRVREGPGALRHPISWDVRASGDHPWIANYMELLEGPLTKAAEILMHSLDSPDLEIGQAFARANGGDAEPGFEAMHWVPEVLEACRPTHLRSMGAPVLVMHKWPRMWNGDLPYVGCPQMLFGRRGRTFVWIIPGTVFVDLTVVPERAVEYVTTNPRLLASPLASWTDLGENAALWIPAGSVFHVRHGMRAIEHIRGGAAAVVLLGNHGVPVQNSRGDLATRPWPVFELGARCQI